MSSSEPTGDTSPRTSDHLAPIPLAEAYTQDALKTAQDAIFIQKDLHFVYLNEAASDSSAPAPPTSSSAAPSWSASPPDNAP